MSRGIDLLSFFKRSYTDVAGMDIGATGVKIVRLAHVGGQLKLMGAAILPPLTLDGSVSSYPLPKPLKPKYVALASSTAEAQVKLLTLPAHSDKPMGVQVGELMGVKAAATESGDESTDLRVGYETVQETRTESKILAVVFPDSTARAMCALFPLGIPAPCSIEISGLASMSAYSLGPGVNHADDCVAVIDCGASTTFLAFFNKGSITMVRKFDFGANTILKKLQDNLGVDRDVAVGILGDESFDVSRIIHQAMESFLQQITISFDFVERRENVHVKTLYATGGGVALRHWTQEIETATGYKPVVWNPFADLIVEAGAYPGNLVGQESRFAAAVGAARSMMKVS